jgi:hypothetical protein
VIHGVSSEDDLASVGGYTHLLPDIREGASSQFSGLHGPRAGSDEQGALRLDGRGCRVNPRLTVWLDVPGSGCRPLVGGGDEEAGADVGVAPGLARAVGLPGASSAGWQSATMGAAVSAGALATAVLVEMEKEAETVLRVA